ncbi:PREDICTED: rutC family protein in vnfA 5'region-like, partial [Priapulus caudatus]|uniref:RutC family protein in vnfA 5'region-like n=1 Tax=Priapulus caudatus TaxID=37621 RepID=A0ABM1F724_PRICU
LQEPSKKSSPTITKELHRVNSMSREIISTDKAPQAIGPYSQAVKVGSIVYLSGQIPLVPETMQLVEGDIAEQTRQIFRNLAAVAEAAGGTLNDFAKVNVFLTDLSNFAAVNEVMAETFSQPYPARAAIGVAALPKGAEVEVDGIMSIEA